jgi:hypothetical protein
MELTKEGKDIMNRLIEETRPQLNKLKLALTAVSSLAFVLIAWVTYSYWAGKYGSISHTTSLILGGQLFTLFGAGLTAAGASYNTSTITLMSMTKLEANPDLFYELRKTSILTRWGLYSISFGFLVQAASMILNETIGL